MTKIILDKLFSRDGKDIIITAPTNASEVLKGVKVGTPYVVTYRLYNSKDSIIGDYMGATEFNKSLRFRHSERTNEFGNKVEMLIPTQNIISIQDLN